MTRVDIVKWRRTFGAAVFALAALIAPFTGVHLAHAASVVTWTGAGGDAKFSTAGNWQGGVAPVAGDTILLPSIDDNSHTLTNDLGVALGGVNYGTVGASNYTNYVIDTLHLEDGATVKRIASGAYIAIDNSFTADGALTFDGTATPFAANSKDVAANVTGTLSVMNNPATCSGGGGSGFTFNLHPTGPVVVGPDSNYTLIGSEGSISVGARSTLSIWGTSDVTYNGDITLAGGEATACGSPWTNLNVGSNVTLGGKITLQGNATYNISNAKTLTLKGQLSGSGYALSKFTGSAGTFVNNTTSNDTNTPGGTQETAMETLPPVTDNQPSAYLYVAAKTTVALDGARGDVSVGGGGVLKGTGIANTLYVDPAGVVAPGHSPGKLTVLKSLMLNDDATYQAELQTKDAYDQIQVGKDYTDPGSAVTLGSGAGPVLDVSLYSGWSIKKGDAFTIIDNQSSTAVSGTFKNLAEGTQFVVDGITFSISYVGGDGNDVVITALSTGTDPNAPNTGAMKLILGNPILVAVLGVVAAGFLGALALRRKSNR